MAVLKREYTLNTYQARQLDSLKNIEKTLKDFSRVRTGVIDPTFGHSLSKFHTDLKSWLAPAVISSNRNLVIAFSRLIDITRDNMDTSEEVQDIMRSASRTLEESLEENTRALLENTDRQRRSDRYRDRERKDREKEQNSLLTGFMSLGSRLLTRIGNLIDGQYAQTGELMIMSGGLLSDIQGFRSDIGSVVSELNKVTGGRYEINQSLSTIMTIMNNSSIRNLDTLENISASVLLANKSLDVNLGSVSKYMMRLYETYNLSAAGQNQIVTNLLRATAGRNVSADQVMSFLESPEMTRARDEYMNRSLMSAEESSNYFMTQLANYSAVISSMNLDRSGSGFYESFLRDVLTGTNVSENIKLSEILGIDYNELLGLSRESDFATFQDLLINGMSDLYDRALGDSSLAGDLAEIYGLDLGILKDASLAMQGQARRTLSRDSLMQIYESGLTPEDLISQRPESLEERLYNLISEKLTPITSFFESIGVNIGDILTFWGMANIFMGGASLTSTLSTLFKTFSIGKVVKTLTDSAAGGGAGAVGLAATLKALLTSTGAKVAGGTVTGLYTMLKPWNNQLDDLITDEEASFYATEGWGSKLLGTTWPSKGVRKLPIDGRDISPELSPYFYSLSGTGQGVEDFFDSDGNLISYGTGTNYISQDQIALLHKGEAVIPERYNPDANHNELERLRRLEMEEEEKNFREVVDAIREVKDFLQLWKKDGELDSISRNLTQRSSGNISNISYEMM